MVENELSFDDIDDENEEESKVEELSFDDVQEESDIKETELSFDDVGKITDDAPTDASQTATPAFTPPKEGFTYEQFTQSPELKAAAMRFARNRLGYDNISEDEAIDETIEHFRQFKVNELTAGKDWNYTSALANDNKRQEINDYKSLYRATEAMEDFGGGVLTTVGDYLGGIFTAPSTALGLLLPGGGKLAGVAAQQTAKLGVGRAIAGLAANPIKTMVATEATAGVLQDVAEQKSLMAVDEQDDYSFGQTITTGIISGVAPAVVSTLPLYLAKKYGSKAISKRAQTDELLETSQKAVEEKTAKAEALATKTLEDSKETGTAIKERLAALNADMVEEGKQVGKDIADTQGIDEPLRVAVMPDKINRVAAAATEVLADSGGLKQIQTGVDSKTGEAIFKSERITEAISRVIRDATDDKTNKALTDTFGEVLNKYNLTQDDFANLFISEFSEAGRLLQKAGHEKKQLKTMMSSIDEVASSDIFSLNENVLDVFAKSKKLTDANDYDGFIRQFDAGDTLRSLDALRLAAMTSQVGTTVRNTVGGGLRVGFDVLTNVFDASVQAVVSGTRRVITGEKSTQTIKDSFKDSIAIAYGLVNKDKAIAVEEIFAMGFQTQAKKLYRQLADLEDVTGVGLKGKNPPSRLRNITTGVGRNLNVLNTLSDNMFKRAAFMGGLERELRKMKRIKLARGDKVTDADFDLMEIMKKGDFNKVFGTTEGKKALDRGIEEALYFTYQASPKSTMGQLLVKGANNLPFITTSVVPFPRFLANAMRFTYEYSPLYLANKKVRAELARSFRKEGISETGEELGIRTYHETAKGLAGLGMLYGALAFRNSENAGEKWYEGRSADGQTYDMRPFFPAAPYLFFAHLIERSQKGEDVVDKKTFRESLQAVTGMQVGKAGFGLYAMDKLVDDIGNVFDGSTESSEAIGRLGAEFTANILSTYTMPLTPLQDTYNTFLAPDDERIIRDNNIEDLSSLIWHKALSRVPGNFAIEKMLKEAYGTEYELPKAYESPTRTGVIRRTTPISRQLTGRLYQEKKTDIEKELDRLRITKADVLKRTGIPAADALLGFYMGEFMTDIVQPFIKSDFYKNLPENVKKQALKEEIAKVRKQVKDIAKKTIVYEGSNQKANPMNRVSFKRLPKIYRQIAINTYNKANGEPTSMKDYDYAVLLQIARDLSTTKLRNVEFKEQDIRDELNEDPTIE